VKRVCTKGCNQLLKVLKNKAAQTEGEIFDLVVCQADKEVVCDPSGIHGGSHGLDSKKDDLGGSGTSPVENSCGGFKAGFLAGFLAGR
jgi:hypothetical protein